MVTSWVAALVSARITADGGDVDLPTHLGWGSSRSPTTNTAKPVTVVHTAALSQIGYVPAWPSPGRHSAGHYVGVFEEHHGRPHPGSRSMHRFSGGDHNPTVTTPAERSGSNHHRSHAKRRAARHTAHQPGRTELARTVPGRCQRCAPRSGRHLRRRRKTHLAHLHNTAQGAKRFCGVCGVCVWVLVDVNPGGRVVN